MDERSLKADNTARSEPRFNAMSSEAKQDTPCHPVCHKHRCAAMVFLLLSSFGLAFAGQFYFAKHPQYLLDGVLLYSASVALFVLVVQTAEPLFIEWHPGWVGKFWWVLTAKPLPTAITGLALLLAYAAGRYASAQPPPTDFTPAVLKWVTAGALVIGAQLPSPKTWTRRLRGLRAWVRIYWLELITLAIWGVVAGVLRIWKLEQIPYPLSGDETQMGLHSRLVLTGELRNPFATAWLSHPTMWYFWMSRFMRLFGTGAVGLRIMSALIGTSTVFALYLLAREMFGVAIAQISVALLSTYPFHIHFSRQGLSSVSDPWLATLVFYFFDRGLQRNNHLFMAIGGVALGLLQYGYVTSRVIPIILMAYMLYLLSFKRGFLQRRWQGVAVFIISAFVVWMPMGFWYLHHQSEFTARASFSSILQPGWLRNEQAYTGKTALQVLWNQVQRSLLAFNFYRDTSPFYGAPIPLLSFLPSVFLVFGIAYAALRWREPRMMLQLLWVGLTLLFGSVLTIAPPFASRLTSLIPAVCVLVALGIWKILSLLSVLKCFSRLKTGILTAMVVGLIMLWDVHFYFYEYVPKPYFLDENTEIGNILGQYLAALPADYHVYFFGAPRMYINYPAIEFFAGRKVGMDVVQPLTPQQRPAMVQESRRLAFVFLPERLSELETIREFFPNGEELHFSGRFGSDLFTVYRVD